MLYDKVGIQAAGVIKVASQLILRWEDNPGLSGYASYNTSEGEVDMTESERSWRCCASGFEDQKGPQAGECRQPLENRKARKWILP